MNEIASSASGKDRVTYRQSRLGSETDFSFGADTLKFRVRDKSGSHTFTTQYGNIGSDHDYLVERNSWLEHVGYLWLALGAVFTVLSYTGGRGVPSIWLLIGAVCVIIARVRTIRFTRLHADNGTILVIEDEQRETILGEIQSRRSAQLRRWYDFVDADEEPGRQRSRMQWLHEEGVISDEELAERLRQIDALPRPAEIPGEFTALPPGAAGKTLN